MDSCDRRVSHKTGFLRQVVDIELSHLIAVIRLFEGRLSNCMTRIRESIRFHDRRSPYDRIVHLIDALSYDEVIASNSGPNSSRNIWRKTNERTSSPSPSILSTIDRCRRIVAHDA